MALTKQQIFEQMSKDAARKRSLPQTPSKTRPGNKPADKDQFADLVSKLKSKKKDQ